MKTKIVLTLITVVLLLSSCATVEEKAFKSTATDLKAYLEKLGTLASAMGRHKVEFGDGLAMYYRDYEPAYNFVSDNKDKWETFAKAFRSYIGKFDKGDWSDDAGFCLVTMYMSISIGGTQYSIIAASEIKAFLSNFPVPRIEDWTKKEFRNVPLFRLILKPDTSHWPDSLIKDILELPEETKRIRDFFTVEMIFELLKAGTKSQAEEELEKLQNESKEGSKLATGIRNMLERADRGAEEIRKKIAPQMQ